MFGLGIKEKEKKRRKKTNKGWLKLQKQEREENGVERQIYIPTQGQHEVPAGDGASSIT